jgi:hypothetical protein
MMHCFANRGVAPCRFQRNPFLPDWAKVIIAILATVFALSALWELMA